jgi:heat shock protein HslJ
MLASALSLLVPVACGSGEEPPQLTRGGLLGRTFISAAVTEDGEPRALVPGTRIRVTFEEREDRRVVGWRAGCNMFGADLEITGDRLLVGRIAATLIGCSDGLPEQDGWLAGFLGSDPRWRLSEDRLTLTSGDTVIELEASRG